MFLRILDPFEAIFRYDFDPTITVSDSITNWNKKVWGLSLAKGSF
jgi:hypothetical protein